MTTPTCSKPTLASLILSLDARAWGRYADICRSAGATYLETYSLFCVVFERAGRELPSIRDYEAMMYEAETLEADERAMPRTCRAARPMYPASARR